MSTYRSRFYLSCLVFTALIRPTSAQSSVCADQLSAGIPCCGQYECVEDRPLTLAEARASRSYPQIAQQETEHSDPVAMASAAEPREARSKP